MKKYLFLYLVLGISINILAQPQISSQTINSGGGTYITDQNIMNVSIGEVAFHTYANESGVLSEGFQQPLISDYSQEILIPAGWSGLASYINPNDNVLDSIFYQYESDTLILCDFDSLYIKGMEDNLLNTWAAFEGKRIKINQEFTVRFYGERPGIPSLQFSEGWSILPNLSYCEISCSDLMTQSNNQIELILEIGDDGLFWPDKGISSLELLQTGKSYYIKTNQSIELILDNCNQ